jgi:hypothetical protein
MLARAHEALWNKRIPLLIDFSWTSADTRLRSTSYDGQAFPPLLEEARVGDSDSFHAGTHFGQTPKNSSS